jgi:hypothetical protein
LVLDEARRGGGEVKAKSKAKGKRDVRRHVRRGSGDCGGVGALRRARQERCRRRRRRGVGKGET